MTPENRKVWLSRAEAWFFAVACQYEVVALLFGDAIERKTGVRLPSITRWSADNALKSTAVKAGLDYHFHEHRRI